ncbi:MAG: DUF559 domain-containing protein [Dehalococcoidia bacterium]
MVGDEPHSGEVLVAIMRDVLDFSVLRDELWYRIPLKTVERDLKNRWPPAWLAFYQTKVFGTSAYTIRYYGRVAGISRVLRSDLFPLEPIDDKSRQEYYKLSLHSLEELATPVPSRRLRRFIFIPTTLQKLLAAAEVNDLYDDSPLEDTLWQQFKLHTIDAERQERVSIHGMTYFLDFAVYCGLGSLDVETDGDTYHSNPAKAAIDNLRDNNLHAAGWNILRFNSAQIRDSVGSYCIPKVIETVNAMGGLSRGQNLPRRLPQKQPDGSFQMDMFGGKGGADD